MNANEISKYFSPVPFWRRKEISRVILPKKVNTKITNHGCSFLENIIMAIARESASTPIGLYANMRLNWISLEPRPCPTREILCRLHMCVETMKISMKYVKTAANFTLSGHGRASNRGWSALRIFQTAASTSYSFRAFQDSTFLICQWFAAKCRVVICQLTAFIGSWMSSQWNETINALWSVSPLNLFRFNLLDSKDNRIDLNRQLSLSIATAWLCSYFRRHRSILRFAFAQLFLLIWRNHLNLMWASATSAHPQIYRICRMCAVVVVVPRTGRVFLDSNQNWNWRDFFRMKWEQSELKQTSLTSSTLPSSCHDRLSTIYQNTSDGTPWPCSMHSNTKYPLPVKRNETFANRGSVHRLVHDSIGRKKCVKVFLIQNSVNSFTSSYLNRMLLFQKSPWQITA